MCNSPVKEVSNSFALKRPLQQKPCKSTVTIRLKLQNLNLQPKKFLLGTDVWINRTKVGSYLHQLEQKAKKFIVVQFFQSFDRQRADLLICNVVVEELESNLECDWSPYLDESVHLTHLVKISPVHTVEELWEGLRNG